MSRYIVFKTNSFPTFSETFIVSNIKAAIDAGFKVNIIVDYINSKDNTSQPDLLAQYGLIDKVSKFEQPKGKIYRKIKGISLLFNPILFFYFVKYCFYKEKKSLDNLFVLSFYWKYRKAKIYHVHFATAINPLFELKKIGFLKSKIIVTFHGYDAYLLCKDEQLDDLINTFNKFVAYITVNSQFLKNKLVESGFSSSKINIIPISVDPIFFKRNRSLILENNQLKLITVGRLVQLKGQEYGIRVIKALIDDGFLVHYTIIGDGDQLLRLKKLTQQLNLGDKITFLGARNQIEIKRVLEDHHVFLMTSTVDESDRREAFGVVSLEAQLMGLPVVGFDSGGFPETVKNGVTGFVVEDKNIVAMSNAIKELIFNNDLLKSMSENACNHILETFKFENTTEQYLKLYNNG